MRKTTKTTKTMSPGLRSNPKSSARRAKANRVPWSGISGDWWNAHQTIAFAILSFIWVFALYWRALHAPFVYDDLDQIVNNPNLGSLHSVLTRFFLHPVTFSNQFREGDAGSTYRPIFWLSLALDRKLWGAERASGFHLTNLLLHWLNGLFFFSLLRAVRVPALAAAAAALLWLGLPVNTEAVAWISARAYLLCGLFLLLGLLAAHSYLRDGNRYSLAAYFISSIAALLSHEEGLLLLPLTILLLYATPQISRRSRRSWITLLGLVSLSDLLYLISKTIAGSHTGRGTPALRSVGLTLWYYLQWIVAPVHLSVERSTSTPPNILSPAAITAWIGLLSAFVMLFLLRKRLPLAAAGLAACLLMLLPVSGIVFLYQGMAERFDYMASAGFALFVVALTLECVKAWRGIAISVVVLWALWGAWRVKSRVLQWCDPVQLYQSSLEATPGSSILHYNLGLLLKKNGDLTAASESYKQAIRLRPNYPQALANLGDVYLQLGHPADAIEAYNRALVLRPGDATALVNDAVALEQTGNKQAAEQQLKKAIALAPKDPSPYLDLGVLLSQEDRVDEAIQNLQKAIDLKPSDPTAYYDLAAMFQRGGRNDLAVPFYKKVLELKPGDLDTISNLSKMTPR